MRIRTVVILMLFAMSLSVPTLYGQKAEKAKSEKPLSKKEKRRLAKAKKLEAKINDVIALVEARDFVIKDDGVISGSSSGLYPQSGLVNFFRIKDDTVTFQRLGAKPLGTGIQEEEVINKFQGIIRDLDIIEAEGKTPPRIVVSYQDRITQDYRRTVIYIFPSRVEARREDGTGLVIRGKHYSIAKAKVRELGINSDRILVETAQRY